MVLSEVQIKVLQGAVIALTIIALGFIIWCVVLVLDNKNLQLEIARLEGENVAKTEAMQKAANSVSEAYQRLSEVKNVETKIIERKFDTVVEKAPEVYRVECIDDVGMQLLSQVYAARDSSEPKTADSPVNATAK